MDTPTAPSNTTPSTTPATQPAAKENVSHETNDVLKNVPDAHDYVPTKFDRLRKPPHQPKQEAKQPEKKDAKEPEKKEESKVEAKENGNEGKTTPNEGKKEASEKAKEKLKRKIKIDGQETEVEADEDELWEAYQLKKASYKRFQDADAVKKQMETKFHQFLDTLKKDPVAVLSHPEINHDMRKLAEDYLYKQIEMENMPPEQKELMEVKQKLKIYEQMEQEREEQNKQVEIKQKFEFFMNDYQQKIIAGLEGEGLPPTPESVRRMAYYMKQANDRGHKLSTKEIATLVKQDYETTVKSLLSKLPPDKIIEMVGKEMAEKIRKHDLETFQKTQAQPLEPKDAKPSKPQQREQVTPEEFRRRMYEKVGLKR